MEENDLFILHGQDHCCWWPGDMRSQGINSNGIEEFDRIFQFEHQKG